MTAAQIALAEEISASAQQPTDREQLLFLKGIRCNSQRKPTKIIVEALAAQSRDAFGSPVPLPSAVLPPMF